jgi:hypothetical protein
MAAAGWSPAIGPAALDAAALVTAALADSRSSRDARCGSARSFCWTGAGPGLSLPGAAGSLRGRSWPERSDRATLAAPADALLGAAWPACLSWPVPAVPVLPVAVVRVAALAAAVLGAAVLAAPELPPAAGRTVTAAGLSTR